MKDREVLTADNAGPRASESTADTPRDTGSINRLDVDDLLIIKSSFESKTMNSVLFVL